MYIPLLANAKLPIVSTNEAIKPPWRPCGRKASSFCERRGRRRKEKQPVGAEEAGGEAGDGFGDPRYGRAGKGVGRRVGEGGKRT